MQQLGVESQCWAHWLSLEQMSTSKPQLGALSFTMHVGTVTKRLLWRWLHWGRIPQSKDPRYYLIPSLSTVHCIHCLESNFNAKERSKLHWGKNKWAEDAAIRGIETALDATPEEEKSYEQKTALYWGKEKWGEEGAREIEVRILSGALITK